MTTVTRMSDEMDEKLLARFARAHARLPDAEFVQTLLARMQQARRVRRRQRIAMLVVVASLAAWIMPSVLQTTAAVVRVVAEHAPSYDALIISPGGWAVSMLIGFGVLLRAGALRRGGATRRL
jgi:hypothetical protein